MFKMMGGDGREYGPVSTEQLRAWIAEQRANGQTLVQPEGAVEWRALATFPEFAEALAAAWPGQAGAPLPPPPLTSGGFPPPPSPSPEPTYRGFGDIDVGLALVRGWGLLGRHFGILVGATALVWGLTTLAAFVPFVGWFIEYVISGPLYGGLYLVYLRRIRGGDTGVGEVFSGFGPPFGALMLMWVFTSLLSRIGMLCCLIIPGVLVQIFWIFSLILVADRRLDFGSALGASGRAVGRQFLRAAGLWLIAWLPVIVFGIYTTYVARNYLLEAMGPMSPGSVEEMTKNLMNMLNLLSKPEHVAFVARLELQQRFVLLLNLPFAVATILYAYEDTFGRRGTEADR